MSRGTVTAFDLRAAVPADAPAVAEVFLASRRHGLPYLPERHGDDETRAWIASHIFSTEVVVAVDAAGAVVGFAACTPGELDHLYVHPRAEGAGVGSALLAEAQRRHPEGLELFAFARNARARRFYERRGFVAVAFGCDNEEQEPDVRYRWRPEPS